MAANANNKQDEAEKNETTGNNIQDSPDNSSENAEKQKSTALKSKKIKVKLTNANTLIIGNGEKHFKNDEFEISHEDYEKCSRYLEKI